MGTDPQCIQLHHHVQERRGKRQCQCIEPLPVSRLQCQVHKSEPGLIMIHAVLLKVTGQILTGRPAEGESDSEEDELRPYTRRSLAKHVRSIASRHQYHTHILGPELWVRVHVDYAGLFCARCSYS